MKSHLPDVVDQATRIRLSRADLFGRQVTNRGRIILQGQVIGLRGDDKMALGRAAIGLGWDLLSRCATGGA